MERGFKTTEAKRRANARYRSKNLISRSVTFSPLQKDLNDYFESLGVPFGTYVKELIRQDMERNKGKQ